MKTIPEQHELRAAHVAAHIYYLAIDINITRQEIGAIINIALMMLDNGHSGATAYETGANYVRSISTHPH